MKPSKAPAHSGGVYNLLAELWPKGAFAMMPEVGNATGARTRRHADAVVMSLWPSRGLWLAGVEIKVSRSDWLSELRNPAKADEIAAFCDHWYVAVSEAKIIAEGELPKTWGLIACDSGKAKIIKAAPELTAKPIDRGFVAAMLRRATEFVAPDQWVADKLHAIREEARTKADEGVAHEIKMWKDKAEELSKQISDFETATGTRIRHFSNGQREKFDKVRRAIEEGDVSLDWQADRLEKAAVLMREAANELKKPKDPA